MRFMRQGQGMSKVSMLLVMALWVMTASFAWCANPSGFLWYNLPKPISVLNTPKKGVSFKALSYTDKDAVLAFYTMEALHKAHFTKKMSDERRFLALQDYWLREATLHSQLNQKTLLYYPQYDYSVTHPTSTLGTQLSDALREESHQKGIKRISKTHGILFFYRANNPFDKQQIPIINDFCRRFSFSLTPISVDGSIDMTLPKSRLDQGQSERLGIRYFPAMILVNPTNNTFAPLAFGITTQDTLTNRVIAAASYLGERES